MNLNLSRPLAFIDLETTGIDFSKDRIVEIGLVIANPDGSVIEKSDRVNPGIPIPAGASAIHGIYDKDVANSPSFKQVAPAYVELLNGADLAGFNSNRFDFPFLMEEFLRSGVPFSVQDRKFIDVQRIFHNMERRNLEAAYKFYCGKDLVGAHGALADTRATYEVLMSQLDRYSEHLKNDVNFLHDFSKDGDFVDLGRKMYYDKGVEKFNFGKYKGRSVVEVLKIEPQYFDWIMKSDFALDFKERLKNIKERV